MADDVLLSRDGAVATVTLHRPEVMNACSRAMKEALLATLTELGADPEVRAVVLTGSGRGFCVGQDLAEHAALLAARDPAPLQTVTAHYNPIVRALTGMPKPVIAAVNGVAAGAGASFAFACDLRLAAPEASFLLAFTRVGLAPDSGASWSLPRLVGASRAAELMLLAEPLGADEALRIGLVHRVVPAAELAGAAAELAGRLAAGPTRAYAAVKEALLGAADGDLEAALGREARLQAACGATADHAEAVSAFLAKRRPMFTGA